MLGNICERIPEAEIDKITSAMGADKRIGKYYLKYGPSYGGPCFPRDNRSFSHFAKTQAKIDALIPVSAHKINDFQAKFQKDKILKIIKENKINSLSILGLAYKTKTYVIEESASIKLIDEFLKNKNLKITVYDPIDLTIEETKKVFGNKLNYAKNLNEAIKNKLIILMLPYEEFKKIKRLKNKIVIDLWRI